MQKIGKILRALLEKRPKNIGRMEGLTERQKRQFIGPTFKVGGSKNNMINQYYRGSKS